MIVETKIRLPDSRFFFLVRLFDTVGELQEATEDKEAAGLYRPEPYSYDGACAQVPDQLGILHLARERLGAGYLCHEALHVTFDWVEKSWCMHSFMSKSPHEVEEATCMVIGYFVRDLTNWLIEIKAW